MSERNRKNSQPLCPFILLFFIRIDPFIRIRFRKTGNPTSEPLFLRMVGFQPTEIPACFFAGGGCGYAPKYAKKFGLSGRQTLYFSGLSAPIETIGGVVPSK
jgi:hypothetical protein